MTHPSSSEPNFEKTAEQNTDKSFAEFKEPTSIGLNVQRFLHNQPTAAPFLVLILAVAIFSFLIGDRFLHPFNMSLILQQVTIIGVLGIAQTLIILTAGIDLSVGAIMVLCSVVMGRMVMDFGLPPVLAFGIGMLVGTLAGMINGLLVSRFKLPHSLQHLVRGTSFSH